MIRSLALAMLMLADLGGFAWADAFTCPAPDEARLGNLVLPRASTAVAARRKLDVLVLGGAATEGSAGNGAAFSVRARLEMRLRAALPGVDVNVTAHAARRRSAQATLRELDVDLASAMPTLVIWNAGAIEAGLGSDVDTMAASLEKGIGRIRDAGADVILVDLQYAPSIARIVDLEPYRDAILRVGDANDVAVLDRYEMMRAWSESGLLDLDATTPLARVQVARQVFDCVAAALAAPIATAVRPSAPP